MRERFYEAEELRGMKRLMKRLMRVLFGCCSLLCGGGYVYRYMEKVDFNVIEYYNPM